jgi:AcrR family transcriptional regulator
MSVDVTKLRDGDEEQPIWARPEPGARGATHTREEIAAAAIRIADAEGYDAVSMRRIAKELGAGTMTLYHYVRTKAELLSVMHDQVMGELLIPDGEMPDDWRRAFEEIARRSLACHLRHPWTLEAFRGVAVGPNALRHVEQSLQAAEMSGLEGKRQFELILLIDDYVFGYVVRARVQQRHAGSDPMARAERIRSMVEYMKAQVERGDYPLLERFMADGTESAVREMTEVGADEQRFDRGLATLLDGVEQSLPG